MQQSEVLEQADRRLAGYSWVDWESSSGSFGILDITIAIINKKKIKNLHNLEKLYTLLSIGNKYLLIICFIRF